MRWRSMWIVKTAEENWIWNFYFIIQFYIHFDWVRNRFFPFFSLPTLYIFFLFYFFASQPLETLTLKKSKLNWTCNFSFFSFYLFVLRCWMFRQHRKHWDPFSLSVRCMKLIRETNDCCWWSHLQISRWKICMGT